MLKIDPSVGMGILNNFRNYVINNREKTESLLSFSSANESSYIDIDFDDIPEAPEYKAASYKDFTRETANGLVDADARQGEIGDCSLLSTLRALRNSESGQKALSEIMTYSAENKAWSFSFKTGDFNGKNPIVITQAEVDKAIADKRVSKGDDDVTAIELAVEKYLSQIAANGTEDKTMKAIVDVQNNARAKRAAAGEKSRGELDGLSPYISYLFTGKLSKTAKPKGDEESRLLAASMLNNFNPKTDILVFSQILASETVKGGKGDETSNPFVMCGDDQILGNHAYTVCAVDNENNTVTLRESNNPAETIVVTKEELLQCAGNNTFFYHSFPIEEAEKIEKAA